MPLSAVALSVKPSGHIGSVSIGGDVSTEGEGLSTVELEGPIDSLTVGGKIIAGGTGSAAVRLVGQPGPELSGLRLEAPNGKDLVIG